MPDDGEEVEVFVDENVDDVDVEVVVVPNGDGKRCPLESGDVDVDVGSDGFSGGKFKLSGDSENGLLFLKRSTSVSLFCCNGGVNVLVVVAG